MISFSIDEQQRIWQLAQTGSTLLDIVAQMKTEKSESVEIPDVYRIVGDLNNNHEVQERISGFRNVVYLQQKIQDKEVPDFLNDVLIKDPIDSIILGQKLKQELKNTLGALTKENLLPIELLKEFIECYSKLEKGISSPRKILIELSEKFRNQPAFQELSKQVKKEKIEIEFTQNYDPELDKEFYDTIHQLKQGDQDENKS